MRDGSARQRSLRAVDQRERRERDDLDRAVVLDVLRMHEVVIADEYFPQNKN